MGIRRAEKHLFAVIIAAYGIYAVAYIARTSFLVDGVRYFTLFDDAMISLTYARTFIQGHGLVWFPGAERVEGITNPLWTFWMAFLQILPVSESKVSLLVQLSGLALLITNLVYVRRIGELLEGATPFTSLGAVALTA